MMTLEHFFGLDYNTQFSAVFFENSISLKNETVNNYDRTSTMEREYDFQKNKVENGTSSRRSHLKNELKSVLFGCKCEK